MLTVFDVANRLQISERSVRDLIWQGRLRHMRFGRLVRIPEEALAEIETTGIDRLIAPRKAAAR